METDWVVVVTVQTGAVTATAATLDLVIFVGFPVSCTSRCFVSNAYNGTRWIENFGVSPFLL